MASSRNVKPRQGAWRWLLSRLKLCDILRRTTVLPYPRWQGPALLVDLWFCLRRDHRLKERRDLQNLILKKFNSKMQASCLTLSRTAAQTQHRTAGARVAHRPTLHAAPGKLTALRSVAGADHGVWHSTTTVAFVGMVPLQCVCHCPCSQALCVREAGCFNPWALRPSRQPQRPQAPRKRRRWQRWTTWHWCWRP